MYMEVRYDENAGSVFSSMYMEVRYDENARSVFSSMWLNLSGGDRDSHVFVRRFSAVVHMLRHSCHVL